MTTTHDVDTYDTKESIPHPIWIKSMLQGFSDSFGIPFEDMYQVFESQYLIYTRIPMMTHDQLKKLCKDKNIPCKTTTTRSALLDILLYNTSPTRTPFKTAKPKRMFQQELFAGLLPRLNKVREPLVLKQIPDTDFLYHETTGYVFNASSQVIGKMVIEFPESQIKPLTEADRHMCTMYRFDVEAWTKWASPSVPVRPVQMQLRSTVDKRGVPISYDRQTGYVLSAIGNVVRGKLDKASASGEVSEVIPLTTEDIQWCQVHGVLYSIPVRMYVCDNTHTPLELKTDTYGHEHLVDPTTHYVIHDNKYVVGKWNNSTNSVEELQPTDIDWCQEHHVHFKYPIVLHREQNSDVHSDPKTQCQSNINTRMKTITSDLRN